MTWLVFTLIATIASGIFGVLTHAGQKAMGDSANGQYKALLFAGIGYSLIATVGSGVMLTVTGAQWSFPMKGLSLGILAGIIKGIVLATLAGAASAATALGVLLAFEATGTPAVVMTILFTGASLINAIVSLVIDTPQAGGLRWQFLIGIQLVILGICMVTIYRPGM